MLEIQQPKNQHPDQTAPSFSLLIWTYSVCYKYDQCVLRINMSVTTKGSPNQVCLYLIHKTISNP